MMDIEFGHLRLEHIHMHCDHAPPAFGHNHDDERLINSTDELGILTPPVVMRKASDCYRIVDGHRRYLAAKYLAYDTLLCSIIPQRLSPGEYELLRFQLYSTTKPWSDADRAAALRRRKPKNK